MKTSSRVQCVDFPCLDTRRAVLPTSFVFPCVLRGEKYD
jgi:hypothetical protein